MSSDTRLTYVVEEFEDPMHHDPERARGACHNESFRFTLALGEVGIDAEVVSGFTYLDFNGTPVVLNGHAAARVGDYVYDWTARQFPPHDQPVPLIQPYDEWRHQWRDFGTETP